MPLNGSDVASKPSGTTAVANTTIESAKFNSVVDDVYAIFNTVRSVATGHTGASTPAGARSNLDVYSKSEVDASLAAYGNKGAVRNTVLIGDNNNGAPSFLTTGTSLTPAFTATNSPLILSFSNGFTTQGPSDFVSALSSGGSLVAIAASCISYVAATYVDAANVTWSATKAPPQYGATYNKSAQSCLKLNNNALDDFGNAWTNNGVTYANSNPMIAGTFYGVYDGSTSYTLCTTINTLYPSNSGGGFTIGGRFYSGSLASDKVVFCAVNNAAYGVQVAVLSSGKLAVALSSNGSSWDIQNTGIGGSHTLSANTWYEWSLVCDPVAGAYYVNVGGALDKTISSSAKVCSGLTRVIHGANWNGSAYTNFFQGNIQGTYFQPFCMYPGGTTYSVPTTLPDIAATGYASDWFDLIDQQMKSVSAASVASGSNPTFTTAKKVYVGEASAGVSSVTSVTAYAFNQTGKNGAGLLNAFGYGQATRSTYTGEISRTTGVKYYNTWVRPMEMCCRVDAGSGGGYLSVYVNDKLKAMSYALAGSSVASATVIIPPGGWYMLSPNYSVSGVVVTETV